MPEEKEITQDGGEQPTNTEPVIDENVTPTKEESVDENEDLSEFGVPPMPKEEDFEKEEKEEQPIVEKNAEQEKEVEEREVETPKIPQLEPRPTRLDRRLAKVFIQNMHLSGDDNIPEEEQIIADLKKYSNEEKVQSLRMHLRKRKELRGENPTGNDFEEEDIMAIEDAKRETIRQEILQEEHEKQYMNGFVEFVDNHPELLPENKNYNPKLAKAVETLWKGGMPINEAFETVTESISEAKGDEKKEKEISKQKALSGSITSSSPSSDGKKAMTWKQFDELRVSDPERYEKLAEKLADGKFSPSDDE